MALTSFVNEKERRKTLNKHLWNAAYKQCGAMNDDQSVTWKREGACLSVTQRTRVTGATNDYKELTNDELNSAINYLRNGASELDKLQQIADAHKGKYATQKQIGKLHFLAQTCAIYFADVESVKIQCGDLELTGNDLRKEMCAGFSRGKLTGYIAKYLYSSWINPKIHEFLGQAGFRKGSKVKATYYIKWDEITREEADALIVRFQKITNEIAERYTPAKREQHELN